MGPTTELPIKERRPGVSARLLDKSFFYRRILIEAPIEAILEYRGWGFGEAVFLDECRMVWDASWWRFVPVLNFHLSLDGQIVPAAVHVRTYPWFTLRAFRFEIDGQVVYAEGPWRRLVTR